MDVDFQRIYAEDAERYDEVVAAEDCDGNLPRVLGRVAALSGAHLLDIGTGTGRIARLALAAGAKVVGVEPAPDMLRVARRRLAAFPADSWQLVQGDARSLPSLGRLFDVAVAGWVLGHLRGWFPDRWRSEVLRALDQAVAAVRPGGTLVVIETLGTGSEAPAPPNADLTEYYGWLERERGFRREEVRTDYGFPSPGRAEACLAFFFGDALVHKMRANAWARVPECTGVWWRTRE